MNTQWFKSNDAICLSSSWRNTTEIQNEPNGVNMESKKKRRNIKSAILKLILLKKINHKWSGGAEPMHRFLWIMFYFFFVHCSFQPFVTDDFNENIIYSLRWHISLSLPFFYYPRIFRCKLVSCIGQSQQSIGDWWHSRNNDDWWKSWSNALMMSLFNCSNRIHNPTMGSYMVRLIPNIGCYRTHTHTHNVEIIMCVLSVVHLETSFHLLHLRFSWSADSVYKSHNQWLNMCWYLIIHFLNNNDIFCVFNLYQLN